MRNIFALIVASYALFGCDQESKFSDLLGPGVQEKVQPYVHSYREFLQDIGADYKVRYLPWLSIRFGDIRNDEDMIGYCIRGKMRVVLDEDFWNTAGEKTRTALVYHELTHCIAGISTHDAEPKQIFSARLTNEAYLKKTWSQQLKRLAHRLRSAP